MSDVIIIGGGPAGAAIGSYLSKAGISNTIFESSIFPREHVGESLVTSTTRVFKEIDFLKTMESEGFVHKYGASWHAPTGNEFSIEFREFPQDGVDQEYTYHVNRSKFDLLLLKHAEKLGSKIYQGVPVNQVLFDNGQATGVRVNIDGQNVDLQSKVVVDASGRGTVLGRQLNSKRKIQFSTSMRYTPGMKIWIEAAFHPHSISISIFYQLNAVGCGKFRLPKRLLQ